MFPDEKTVERIRADFPIGSRVMMVYSADPLTPIDGGTEGIVSSVDNIGTIHIDWDNGSRFGVILGENVIEKIWFFDEFFI